MKPPYNDITDKLGAPQWWDDNGTPRYCEPHPVHAPCIYAREVLFYVIKCQACQTAFTVCITGKIFQEKELLEYIKDHGIHYGDPPNFGCCAAGPTMSSDSIRVVSYWVKVNKDMEWKELEEFRNHPLE